MALVLPLARACTAPGRPAASSARTATSSARPAGQAGWRLSWGNAVRVPGIGAVDSLASCASAGDCAAVGYYTGGSLGTPHVVAAAEHGGRWEKGADVLRASGLNVYYAWDAEVWCARNGTCTVRGFFEDNPARHDHQFIVSERNGMSCSGEGCGVRVNLATEVASFT